MSPDAQRMAIAGAVGYQQVYDSPDGPQGFLGEPRGDGSLPIPDYINDLDAMHAAESIIINNSEDDVECRYRDELVRVVQRDRVDFVMAMDCIRATATQRAEAMLKTLSLWDDSK